MCGGCGVRVVNCQTQVYVYVCGLSGYMCVSCVWYGAECGACHVNVLWDMLVECVCVVG